MSMTHSTAAIRTLIDPIAKALAYVARRNWLAAVGAPACPECAEAQQIQLYDWVMADAAIWRCRSCRYTWTWEPSADAPLNLEILSHDKP